jgi:cell division protein FtsL
MKSIDNEANLNRTLTDEQKRRSKAEAELNRQTVELGELKKKISELAIENLNLKQEAKKAAEGARDSGSMKEEVSSMQYTLYELNNEIRELRSQFESKKREAERL